jgi:general secretion pathway protein J
MTMSHAHSQRTTAGFTLIELLIAIVIFAIVGVMAMGGYNQLVDQTEHTRSSMNRVRSLQKAILRVTQDFAELEPRSIRDSLGGQMQPCLVSDTGSTYVAQLTRAGWSNPAGIQRSTLQRVGYRVENNKLMRDYWPVLDRSQSTVPLSQELLDRVTSVKLRFMDERFTWHERWPAIGSSVTQTSNNGASNNGASNNGTNSASAILGEQRPLAVEIAIELEDWGKVVRIIEVPG